MKNSKVFASDFSIRSAYKHNGIIVLYMQMYILSYETDTDMRVFFTLELTKEKAYAFCEDISRLAEGTTEHIRLETDKTTIQICRKESSFEIECNTSVRNVQNRTKMTIQTTKDYLQHLRTDLERIIYKEPETDVTPLHTENEIEKICLSDVEVTDDFRRGKITFDSSWFHVSRRITWVDNQINIFKKDLEDFLQKKKNTFAVYEDFLELTFTNEPICQIKGIVSDFQWPETNDVEFCGRCDIGNVLKEFKKIIL